MSCPCQNCTPSPNCTALNANQLAPLTFVKGKTETFCDAYQAIEDFICFAFQQIVTAKLNAGEVPQAITPSDILLSTNCKLISGGIDKTVDSFVYNNTTGNLDLVAGGVTYSVPFDLTVRNYFCNKLTPTNDTFTHVYARTANNCLVPVSLQGVFDTLNIPNICAAPNAAVNPTNFLGKDGTNCPAFYTPLQAARALQSSLLSTVAGNQLVLNPDGFYLSVAPVTFADTATVDWVLAGSNNTFNVKISSAAGNIISANPDGIFASVTLPTFADTTTVNHTAVGNLNTFDVIVSGAAGNQLQVIPTGLYVPPTASVNFADTNTVDWVSVSGNNTFNVKLSTTTPTANLITAQPDGLAVQWSTIKSAMCNQSNVSTNPLVYLWGDDGTDCFASFGASEVFQFIKSQALCMFSVTNVTDLGTNPTVFFTRGAGGCIKSNPVISSDPGNQLAFGSDRGLYIPAGVSYSLNTAGNNGVGSLISGDTLSILGSGSGGLNVVLAGDTFTISFNPVPATFDCSINYQYVTKDAGNNVRTLTEAESLRSLLKGSLNRNSTVFDPAQDSEIAIRRRAGAVNCNYDVIDTRVQRDYFKAVIDNNNRETLNLAGETKYLLDANSIVLEDVLGGKQVGASGQLQYEIQTTGLYFISANFTVEIPTQATGDLIVSADFAVPINGSYRIGNLRSATIPAFYIGTPTNVSLGLSASGVYLLNAGDIVEVILHFSPAYGLPSANPIWNNILLGGYGSSAMEVRYIGKGTHLTW